MHKILIAAAPLLIMAGSSFVASAPAFAHSGGHHGAVSHTSLGGDTGRTRPGPAFRNPEALTGNGVTGSEPDSIDRQTECYPYMKAC